MEVMVLLLQDTCFISDLSLVFTIQNSLKKIFINDFSFSARTWNYPSTKSSNLIF